MPYVMITSMKRLRKAGKSITYQPGDSIEVGKQTAREWILDGTAIDPYQQLGPVLVNLRQKVADENYGLVITAKEGTAVPTIKGPGNINYGKIIPGKEGVDDKNVLSGVQYLFGEPQVPYINTFIWNPVKPVSVRLLNYGWLRISEEFTSDDSWELAAGLVNLIMTAADVGTSRDRAKTRNMIGSLDLPIYEPNHIWVRKCRNSEKVIAAYAAELRSGTNKYHAFLRAVYMNRVLLCTLPIDLTVR